MKLKVLLLLFITSCGVNNDLENNSVDIELPALRYNQSTAQSYRVLKTTISDLKHICSHQNHPGYPEKQDIVTCFHDVGWMKLLKIRTAFQNIFKLCYTNYL